MEDRIYTGPSAPSDCEQKEQAGRPGYFRGRDTAGDAKCATQSSPTSDASNILWGTEARRPTLENIERCMTYQAPAPDQIDSFNQVRESCLALARTILRVVPDSPDRSTALRELRSVRMWANSAISFRGQF